VITDNITTWQTCTTVIKITNLLQREPFNVITDNITTWQTCTTVNKNNEFITAGAISCDH
jgi:hypothetical protein